MRFAVLWLVVTACSTNGSRREDSSPTPAKPVTTTVTPPEPTGQTAKVYLSSPTGELAVNVEVVSTEPKIERGLMFRTNLPLDAGMLFLMGKAKDWSFWMRNTLISLDIIFITKDMTIAGIAENARPRDESLLTVGKPSLYVLEVNGGWTHAHGVTAGAHIRFENVAQVTAR